MEDKKLINDFELMTDTAELKALSKFSLENPLNDEQFKRVIYLKNKCLPMMK